MIASNNDDVCNNTGDTLSFDIPPAFYQTVWFKLAWAVAFAYLLWTVYALRLRWATAEIRARLGERLQERERIARELHDTLLQDFQAAVLRIQIAASRLKGHPARSVLDEGLDYADKALAEGRNRIRDLRTDTKNLDELSESLTIYCKELSELLPLTFSISVTGTHVEFDPLVRHEIQQIGREAIGNAFRHSQGSSIST